MRNPSVLNHHDETRRNRSIRALIRAREALQLEELYLGDRAEVIEEYDKVVVAKADIDVILDRMTAIQPSQEAR